MIDDVTTLLERALDAGPQGWGYDGLLLAAPPVLVTIALLGRSPFTTAIAAVYVVVFVAAVLNNGLR